LVINCAAYFQDIGYLEPYRLFCEKINCRKTVVCLNY